MSLNQLRNAYEREELSKQEYFLKMQAEHSRLAEYADFIKKTAVSSITISNDCVIFTSRKHNIKIECDPNDIGIPPIVAINLGDYERRDGTMLLRLIDDGMVFFDVGANLGWYGLHVAKLFPNSRVFAFEPIPKTFAYLERNVIHNGLTNMRVFPFGLFSEAASRTFYVNPVIMGAASGSHLATSAGEPQVCKVRTLDDVVGELAVNVDFIKADVEGAELFVVRGGMTAIKRSKPILFLEMLRKHARMFDYHPNEIIKLLGEIGYRCFISQGENLGEFLKMDEQTEETNFVFLHAEKHRAKIEQWACLHPSR